MSEAAAHKRMIQAVAHALGSEFLTQVAFVGGCTTGLLITDDYSRDQVRHTNDVDLIVHVVGYAEWHRLQSQLRKKGFKDILNGDAPTCAMQLGELRVDFMPDDERILGFSNRWYTDALATAQPYDIAEGIEIRLVTPAYFVATKLEAYRGRGHDDPLGSQDIEDLLNLFHGRSELLDELREAPAELQNYISQSIGALMKNPGMDHAVQGCCAGREEQQYLYEKLDAAVAVGS